MVGRTVSTVDAILNERAEAGEFSLLTSGDGGLGPDGLNLSAESTRVGDAVISEALIGAEDWDLYD